MFVNFVFICAIIGGFSTQIKCAKILGIFPMVGHSHFKLSSALMRGLAEAGNDVTIVCPFYDNVFTKNGSYRSIVLDGFAENYYKDLKDLNLFEMQDFNSFMQEATFQEYMYDKMEKLIQVPGIQQLMKSNETFDAVIIEQFSNDALKVFAHIFEAHLIVFAPIGPYNFVNRLVANPTMVSYNPQVVSSFERPMSLRSRVHNTLLYVFEEIINQFVFLPKHNEFIKKHFPGAPNIYELTTNVSLLLLNSHESLWQSIPLVPNAIPIGGYHITPPKKLPEDIQQFLDSAKDGVIFFSLGSNLKISDMPLEQKKMFLNVFRNIKEKVIWTSDENIPNLPKNVKIGKWFPQMDILAHPNIKLFITHSGLLSMTEAIYNGVPVLAIPVFGDQGTNANNAVKNGYGLSIIYHEFTEEKFRKTLQEILNNHKYKEAAIKQSKIYHDRPMKPMDRAIYWVDYVIKHDGAHHLRVDGLYLPWYEYFLLDVIGVLIFIIVILIQVARFVWRNVFVSNSSRNIKYKKH